MSVKKIVIDRCTDCTAHAGRPSRPGFYVCCHSKKIRNLPLDGSIPDWCPLPDDHQPTTINHGHAGSYQRVAVSHGYTLLDSRTHPAPIGVKLLCYSSRLGTTVLGEFQQASEQNPYGHTGWIGMPDVPDSLKDWKP